MEELKIVYCVYDHHTDPKILVKIFTNRETTINYCKANDLMWESLEVEKREGKSVKKLFDTACEKCNTIIECVRTQRCLSLPSEIPTAAKLKETLKAKRTKELNEVREKIKTEIICRIQSLTSTSEKISIKNTFEIPHQDFINIIHQLVLEQGYRVNAHDEDEVIISW